MRDVHHRGARARVRLGRRLADGQARLWHGIMSGRLARPLLAGVAVADVTPPVGIDVSGYSLRLGTTAIHRPLRASAVVFSDGERTVCLVAADVVGLTVPYATRLREDIAARLEIEPANVLVTCSHTHNAPSLAPELKIGGRMDEWTELDGIYEAFWRVRVISACAEAAASLVPARLASSRDGTAAIGVNRRLRLPDGRVIMGRVKDRPVDHSVGVVRVDRLDGTPLVSFFNYACHAGSLGPDAEIISPDYPGAARQTLEEVTGAPAIFIQGACGDIAPIDGMGTETSITDALGTTLGLEAAKVWSTIETRNIERREEIVHSYNLISSLVKIEHPLPDAYVGAVAQWLELPLLPPPTPDEVGEIGRAARARYDDLVREGASDRQLNVRFLEVRWARYLERTLEQGALPTTTPGLVQALRVGEVTFVTLPVEPFVLIGRGLIDAIGPHTIVCGYANGTIGYCPMPSDHEEGGYEAVTAHRVYMRPAALAPEVPGILVEAGVRMARGLAVDAEAATPT